MYTLEKGPFSCVEKVSKHLHLWSAN